LFIIIYEERTRQQSDCYMNSNSAFHWRWNLQIVYRICDVRYRISCIAWYEGWIQTGIEKDHVLNVSDE